MKPLTPYILFTGLILSLCSKADIECKPDGLLEHARLGQVECVKKAAQSNEIDFNVVDSNGRNILHLAGELREKKPQALEIAKIALSRKTNIEQKDKYEDTPLCKAVFGLPEVAKLLIDSGADVKVPCFIGSTLRYATELETLKLLIEKGADVNRGKPISQHTNWAILNNEYDREADPESKSFQQDLARIQILLDNGADIAPAFKEAERLAGLAEKDVTQWHTYRFLKNYRPAK